MAGKPKSIEECTEETKNPIIVLEEKGKKMIFRNDERKTVKKIAVDGCAVVQGSKCDFLVISDESYELFVELKGTDIAYACEQLSASIKTLGTNPTQKAKHSFVIGSRIAPAITTRIQIQQARFKRDFNCTLVVKGQQFEFNLKSVKNS
jgi:hypothetical protein